MYGISGQMKSRKPYGFYDKANLIRAFNATKSGMSVYRAAQLYKVPESTLRDRTRCKVELDARSGPERIFSVGEERQLVQHVKYMADIGYGYTKSNIQYMAADFARSIGKQVKAEKGLSDHWFYGLLKRLPDLKMAKPQKLQISRAKSTSKEVIDKYFSELEKVLKDNNSIGAPQRIYNVDETGISTEHAPPKIVCSKETNPQAVTSERSANVTIIAGVNAIGNHVPPFYVFPGKKWMDELMVGAPVGSVGTMSDKGWSNSLVFEKYLTEHLAKHAALTEGTEKEATLIMYDGHKSHLSLTLTEWAKKRKVILFVLPPHTSHLTQPLDVAVFGPFKSQYYKECQSYLQRNPGVSITRYEVASLTAKPYLNSLCPQNITAGFKKSGIYPFNKHTLTPSQLAPATIYQKENDKPTGKNTSNNQVVTIEPTSSATINQHELMDCFQSQTHSSEIQIQSLDHPAVVIAENPQDKISNFFEERKITKVVQRPKKKFIPPFSVTGNLLKKSNVDILTTQAKQNKVNQTKVTKKTEQIKTSKQTKGHSKRKTTKKIKTVENETKGSTSIEPQPSTSGIQTTGGPININTPDLSSDTDLDSVHDEEKCCSCGLFHPKQLQECTQLVFVKWGECTICKHWTHLGYCTDVRVLRRGDIFRCPHCVEE